MNRVVISGASGDLGRRITALVLERIGAAAVTLVTRTPGKLADRAAQGVAVRRGDFNDSAALESAYAGGDTLMLISGLAVTRRVAEHRNAIAAARTAGIRHIVYTSTAGIHPRNPTLSARDHIVTERDLVDSGLGYTILRNACYAEAIATVILQPALRTGRWTLATGEGVLAPVSKRDVARAAASCLCEPQLHNGAVYEISGPELLGFRAMAAIAAEVHGRPITYVPVTPAQRLAEFDALGIPRHFDANMSAHPDAHMWASDEMVSADMAFAQNFHAILSRHVEFITGRQPHSVREVLEFCKGKSYEDC